MAAHLAGPGRRRRGGRSTGSEKTKEVDQYLEQLEPNRREALTELRALIHEVAPEVVETMQYRMPTYEHGEGKLCAFASQKRYISLYLEVEMLDKHRQELEALDLGKSCVRFKRLEQLPLDTIRRILEETAERLQPE